MLSTAPAMLCVCFVGAGNQTCFSTTKTPNWTPLMATRTFFYSFIVPPEGEARVGSDRFIKEKKCSVFLILFFFFLLRFFFLKVLPTVKNKKQKKKQYSE